jgi:hypothetical protein
MDDVRKLGEKNWRNAARNKDGWRKLLKKDLAHKIRCRADDDDDEIKAREVSSHFVFVDLPKEIF